jgi:hypothetical protein
MMTLLSVLILWTGASAFTPAVPLEEITILVLAPVEGRAVLKLPGGELVRLAVGDAVPGSEAVVRSVLPDKLVVEQVSRGQTRTVWMIPGGADAATRLRVLDPRPPAEPEILIPLRELADADESEPSPPEDLPSERHAPTDDANTEGGS